MKFYGGRFSLLPIKDNIFYLEGEERKINHILKLLSKDVEFKVRKDTTLIIEPTLDESGNLVGGKIGRETEKRLPVRPEGNLTKISAKLYPHVMFLIKPEEQVILIEKNTEIFSDIVVFKYLKKYLNQELFSLGLEVDIKPLTSKGQFWSSLENMKSVYNVKFMVKAPNFFGESYRGLKKILDKEKVDSNANQVEFGVSNERGELSFQNKEKYDSVIGWIEDGGGDWIINAKEKGKRRRNYRSSDYISIFEVNEEIDDYDVNPLNLINSKIDIGDYKKGNQDD